MNILDVSIVLFIIMESANVCILYFFPDSRKGNGVAAFNEWEESKKNEDSHLFASYMASWVAGVKLIFILLLVVILFTNDETTKILGVVVMILSIASYFWKLRPIIGELDRRGKITPKGYSKALNLMIIGMISMFTIALISHLAFF
ncbi:MAG: hypothetical protein R3Y54_11640 [Eubacteriales bacterium]